MTAERFQIDPYLFGKQTLVAKHALHQSELFTDESLIEILDKHPTDKLFVHGMSGPVEEMQWFTLDHRGLSGKHLLEAVRNGRIWINVTGIQSTEDRIGNHLSDLYARLEATVPGLKILAIKATLLISSPSAEVYYHVDAPANLLWHIRGQKRLFVYPALDTHFASQENLEKIFTREAHEGLPFSAAFDKAATAIDLHPGEFASWPHSAPHRVANLGGLNVSLSTEHYTAEIYRREHIYCANRFFRGLFKAGFTSTRETGFGPFVKATAYRILRKFGLHSYTFKAHKFLGKVDPSSASGWRA